MQPILNTSPQFGFLSVPTRQAMMQAQYGLSAKDAVALTQQSDAFIKHYYTTMIPCALGGLGLGLLGARYLKTGIGKVLLPILGMILGQVVAGIVHWPESKRLYAAMRDKSTRQYPAYLDKLYGYQQNP